MASRPQCNAVAMTFVAEAAYGTAVIDASINKRFDPTEPVILGLTKTKVDDAERTKGHEFPTDGDNKDIVIARDISIPFSFDSSVEVIGLMGAIFFGADSVAGSLPNFTHTFKAANLCVLDQFPSVSWFLGLIGDTSSFLKVKGVLVNELRLVMDSQGFLTVSGTAMTDGTLESDVGYVFPTVEHPVDYIVGTESDFLVTDGRIGVDACITSDDSGASFIDLTDEANSAAANDIAFTDPMDTNDALYVGRVTPFSRISFLIGTTGSGTTPATESVWEYSTGSDTWATLTVVDGTTAFEAAPGEALVTFDIPTDWVTDTVNGQGPFFYIRFRATADAIWETTSPLITQIGNATALVSQKTILRGFELTMTNNLDVGDARSNVASAGQFLGSLRAGTREYSLTVTVEGHQGDAFWADMDHDIIKDVQLSVTKDANRSVVFDFNTCKIENITQRFDGIRDVMDLQYKLFFEAGAINSPMVMIVKNGDAEYLT